MEVDVDGLLPGGRMKISEQSNNVFCLHLISTNYDMEVEKDVLYKDVFPKIEHVCHHQGWVLEVIEHPPDAASSHSTRKQDIDSSCHCILVLLGEKRCPISLPKIINAREFKALMQTGEDLLEHTPLVDTLQNSWAATQLDLKQDMKSTLAFLERHYKKDLNSVPPSFLLQPDHKLSLGKQLSSGNKFKDRGHLTLEKIIFCLQRIARQAHSTKTITTEAVYKYVYPALAYSTQACKVNPTIAAQHVICVKRHFEDFEVENFQNIKSAEKFFDLLKGNSGVYWDDQTQRYLNELEKKFANSGTFLFYSVDWVGDGVSCKQNAQYVERVRTGILHKLTEIVNGYKMRSEGKNADHSLSHEIQRHSIQLADICSSFSGNPELLAQVGKLLQTHSMKLVLHGDLGSGKTFLCGQIVKIFTELHGPSCVNLFRFLGPYDRSCPKHHVLESLVRQLYQIVQNNNCYVGVEQRSFSRPEEAVQCLLDMLASIDRPCLIVLDSIDNVHEGEILLSGFLSNLPKNVSCVLSVASDNLLNICLNSLKRGVQNVQMRLPSCQSNEWQEISSGAIYVVNIPCFKTSASAATINRVLKHKNRCLTAYQRDQVITVSSKFQNALFTELLANEASLRCSYDQFEWMNKMWTLDDLLGKIWNAVEFDHGEELVRKTLCYLVESKCGLSEVELIDIFHKDSQLSRRSSPQERGRLTFSLRKLLGEIKHLLSEVVEGRTRLMTLKHSCVVNHIRKKYVRDSKASIHTVLANYWMNTANKHPTIVYESHDVLSKSAWWPGKVHSFRSFGEVPYHLIHSQHQSAFNDLLLNPDWICGKIITLSAYAIIDDYELAAQKWPAQGYGRISEALSIVGDVGDDIEMYMQEFMNYLHPYRLCFSETVGKLCDKIKSWLTKRQGNRYVMCIGAQTSGPLLTRKKLRALAVTISKQRNELFAVTEGYLISYSMNGFKVNRMKRILGFPPEDTYWRLEIHQRSGGSYVLALYTSLLIGLFNMDSLECVETIPYTVGSELSPSTEFLLSNPQGCDLVIQSVSLKEVIMDTSAQSGQQRHLLFSKDDNYEIFEDIKNLSKSPHQQSVAKVLNTRTGSVTALSEVVVPTDFQVKACSYQLQSVLVGVLKTPGCPNQDFPKEVLSYVQRVQLFHLSTSSRTLDINMPMILSFMCCDSQEDQFIAGNESKACVYGLPDGCQACEIKNGASETVIIRGPQVIFYGNSTVKVYSSRNGHLLLRWETGADNPGDRYWLTDDGSHLVKHTLLDKTGIVESWTVPMDVSPPEQGYNRDPSFRSLTYSASSGLIVGVSADGYVATINTCKKAYRWMFSQIQIDHLVDKLVLAPDASMGVALGEGVSVFDICAERVTRINHFKKLKIQNGCFVDAVLSENNKRLTIVEKGTCQKSFVHCLKLDAADLPCATFECIQGRISLGRSKTVFMAVKDNPETGDAAAVHLYEVTTLANNKPLRKLRLEADPGETLSLCLSPDEAKLALVSTVLNDGQEFALTLSVKIFDANELTKICEYKKRNPKCADVNQIIVLSTVILIFTSLDVQKLDLTSGIFSEMVSKELLNAVTSRDENFFVATSSSREIYLVNIRRSELLVKQSIPLGMPTSIFGRSHLDTLFMFARGMTHPHVLTANEELREAMQLDRSTYDLPCFQNNTIDDSPPCRIENVTQILLSDFHKKTQDTRESTIFCASSTEDNIFSLELHNETSSRKTNQEIENKAYFVKHMLNKGPLKTDTVRYSGGYFSEERRSSNDREHFNAKYILPFGQEAHYVISSDKKVDKMDTVQTGSDLNSDSESESSGLESTASSYSESTSDSESSGGTPVRSEHNLPDNRSQSVNELPVFVEQSLFNNRRGHEDHDNLDAIVAHERAAQPAAKSEPLTGMSADSTGTSSEVSGMNTKPVKQAASWNYFASSESEQDYDGGAEDNTLSDMEPCSSYSSQKASTVYTRTDDFSSEGDHSLQSDGEEPMSTELTDTMGQGGGERGVLVHRPATYNYFMSDDENDSDGRNKHEEDGGRRKPLGSMQPIHIPSWHQEEMTGRPMNMSADVQPRFSEDTKQHTSSKACALM